jgi:hypothetical protein
MRWIFHVSGVGRIFHNLDFSISRLLKLHFAERIERRNRFCLMVFCSLSPKTACARFKHCVKFRLVWKGAYFSIYTWDTQNRWVGPEVDFIMYKKTIQDKFSIVKANFDE